MFNLASILYTFISATIVGIFIVAALVAGYDTLVPLLVVIAAGFVVSIPVSYFVAKAMSEME